MSQTKLVTIIGLVVIVAVVVIGVTIASKPASDVSKATPTVSAGASSTASPAASAAATTTATSSAYKDGTYSASGSYVSPGGSQAITISVTIAGDTVTATTAIEGATDSESSEYQEKFISGYKSLVVGKSLDSLNLSVVSGSSLTSEGFNNAIAAIKAKAKA